MARKHTLSEDDTIKVFFQLSFFQAFNIEEKMQLAQFETCTIRYPDGAMILEEGDSNCNLYIVLKGLVYITKKSAPSVKLAELKPGAVFGEIAFLIQGDVGRRMTNVIAQGETLVLKLDSKILQDVDASMQVKIRDQLLRVLIKKLDNINNTLIDYIRMV